MAPTVAVNHLAKTFPRAQNPAVADITFALQSGDVLALLGPNGAGKTTTVKMILGLITPTSGTVQVCGHDITIESQLRQAMSRVGAVLEGARNSYWRLSARDNLLYFGSLRGMRAKRLGSRADELLKFLDLHEVAGKEVRHFSRGMQQKLAIAIALIHDPDVLLLDEPTLGLDVQAARLLEQRIADLAQQGKTILLTTHTMSLAERLASHIFVIHQGREVAYDARRALIERFSQRSAVDILLEGTLSEALTLAIQTQFPGANVQVGEATHVLWPEPSQSQVIQLFEFLDKAGKTVLSVNRREASLEEVFLTLTDRRSA